MFPKPTTHAYMLDGAPEAHWRGPGDSLPMAVWAPGVRFSLFSLLSGLYT